VTPEADVGFLHDEEALEEEQIDRVGPPGRGRILKRDTSRSNPVRRPLYKHVNQD
jgi:hypothetical protein